MVSLSCGKINDTVEPLLILQENFMKLLKKAFAFTFIFMLSVSGLTGYQVNRILAFINPGKFADLNVQQDNSKMAIGSGMLYGKGLLNETAISVKNGNFLSEEHTDFIFAVIGEEMGFVGCMLVLVLYLLFVFECLRMAGRTRDLTGKLLCTGIAALVGFQAFTNIADRKSVV